MRFRVQSGQNPPGQERDEGLEVYQHSEIVEKRTASQSLRLTFSPQLLIEHSSASFVLLSACLRPRHTSIIDATNNLRIMSKDW